MISYDFDSSILDESEVFEHCKDEILRIYNSPTARRGRSMQEVGEACMKGAYAEVYLIKYHKYKNNNKAYHDLVSSSGIETEVKVRSSYTKASPESVVESCKPYNSAKQYFFFQNTSGSTKYKFIKLIQL